MEESGFSWLVLIYNFFEETYFCHPHEIHLKFIIFDIYFYFDDSKLEIIPFYKSRDDGADMQCRKRCPTRNCNQGLCNVL